LLGTLVDREKRLWRRASLSTGAPFGEPGGWLIYRGFETDEGGSVDEAALSEEAPWRGPQGELFH